MARMYKFNGKMLLTTSKGRKPAVGKIIDGMTALLRKNMEEKTLSFVTTDGKFKVGVQPVK